jgi:carbon starvation protein
MHALWFMLAALAVLAIAYRFYAGFIAAKVLALDDARRTPAHEKNDGQNYHPTNKWVLFGHHFAAITGAGPLVGPVLAAQFGFLPGYLWILFGVCLGGAVHDFVILVASVRRGGRSLAEIAREELGPIPGFIAALSIFFIVVIALAGLGRVVVGALAESAWGVFAIGVSIPLALLMGLWIYRVRGGSVAGVREATVVGVFVLLLAVVFGKEVQDSSFGALLRLDETTITLGIAAYGFVASVLPVWMLLCPRDYLSSYLKIGTILLLVLGVCVVNPAIEMPLLTDVTATAIHVDGASFLPVVKGSLFPFVFITIACGAISGFHSLVASGTTPKMVSREGDMRAIGYGAMLMEGLVGITALLAAVALPPADYFAINTDPKVAVVAPAAGAPGLVADVGALAALDAALSVDDRQKLGLAKDASLTTLSGQSVKLSQVLRLSNPALAAAGFHVDAHEPHATELSHADFARLGVKVDDLPRLSAAADEVVAARTGGAVSLAVGMARVFSNLPGMSGLLSYWYHFAIMFEALFILTTIDTGTRVGRFILQEMLARSRRRPLQRLGDPASLPAAALSTGIVVVGWAWLISSGSIATIWPMFGIANQLLAAVALVVGTTIILKEGRRRRYALVTGLPLLFVGSTTLVAGVRALLEIYLPMIDVPQTATIGRVCSGVTVVLLFSVLVIMAAAGRRWAQLWTSRTTSTVSASS